MWRAARKRSAHPERPGVEADESRNGLTVEHLERDTRLEHSEHRGEWSENSRITASRGLVARRRLRKQAAKARTSVGDDREELMADVQDELAAAFSFGRIDQIKELAARRPNIFFFTQTGAHTAGQTRQLCFPN